MIIYHFRVIASAIFIILLVQCAAWSGEILYLDIDTIGGAVDIADFLILNNGYSNVQ